MPGYLLHQNATVHCTHTPLSEAAPNQANRRVKVSGQHIVTMAAPYTVRGCTANSPCATAVWTSAAIRVRASGQPVLLTDSQALCAPTGATLKVASTQTRVKGT